MSGSGLDPFIPDQAMTFAGFVLAHCAAIADSNRDGELICPFAVLRTSGEQRVVDFESETQAEAVEKGWNSLSAAQATRSAWSFGRESIFRNNGTAQDVLTVSAWLPDMTTHISVIQRFHRGPQQELVLLGEPELMVHEADGAIQAESWSREALQRGIASPPQGDRWSEWGGR